MAAGLSSPSNSLSKLTLNVECPVCTENLTAPIFLCNTGHSICEKCKEKLAKCPICEAKWSPGRNFAMENMLSPITRPYRSAATGEIMFFGLAKTCPIKTVKCPYYSLNTTMNPRDGSRQICLINSLRGQDVHVHLEAMHGFEVNPSNLVQKRIWIASPICYLRPKSIVKTTLSFDEKHFIVAVLSRGLRLSWVVLFIGARVEEACYRAKVSLQPGTKECRTWEMPIHSTYDRTVLSFLDEGHYIPGCKWDALKRLSKCEGKALDLTFTVSISKYTEGEN